eukprot:TRINITY_DN493_c7_g2_i2.p5 TRINITY_DN493_c7_g2~~TRINITY_DN493_c7_g2_i2.p5  ORF type:complete len:300 (+),score=102.21 TRINITY_DN493_c7_g2_i2:3326-4225(+)
MLLPVVHGACLILAAALGADEAAAPPRLKATPDAMPAAKKQRHFLVQVRLIEVDEHGRETVLGEPKLQTTGGNAGMSIDHGDGRRFEFTMKLTDRLGSAEELIPAKSLAPTTTEGVIKKLDQKIDLSVHRQPRKDVLREISKRAGVSFSLDPESSREILAGLEVPIDVKAKDEAIASILDQVIEPLKLEYAVRQDIVLIAAAEKLVPLPEDFVIKTYHVADLVADAEAAGEPYPDLKPLIERIKATVMPASWDRKTAAASIRSFDSTSSIVVRQTATGHAAIERFLEKVRREPPMKITE